MLASRKFFSSLAAVLALGAFAAGCDGGVDLEVNAPLLNAAGLNVKEALLGKKAPSPNLPDRAPLVLPPQNAPLPVPGQAPQQTALDGQQWPADPEEAKKQAAKAEAAKKEDYCKNGDWSDRGGINEFNKNSNQDTRCRPSWISRVLGSDDSQKAE